MQVQMQAQLQRVQQQQQQAHHRCFKRVQHRLPYIDPQKQPSANNDQIVAQRGN
jgi:hypothetical protein